MDNVIELIIGDASGDGHDKRTTVAIKSNLTKEQIVNALSVGEKALGFKLRDVCSEYEDSTIPEDVWEKLKAAGFLEAMDWDDWEDKESYSYLNLNYTCGTDSFADLFLFIVKCGNDKFQYELDAPGRNSIYIGGYGLFD